MCVTQLGMAGECRCGECQTCIWNSVTWECCHVVCVTQLGMIGECRCAEVFCLTRLSMTGECRCGELCV